MKAIAKLFESASTKDATFTRGTPERNWGWGGAPERNWGWGGVTD